MIPLRVIGAGAVLAGDPVAIGACGDISHPFLIVQIPSDRLPQAGFEAPARRPAELALDLSGIDGVAAVVARAIGYEGDLPQVRGAVAARPLLVERRADELHQRDVGHLIGGTDI